MRTYEHASGKLTAFLTMNPASDFSVDLRECVAAFAEMCHLSRAARHLDVSDSLAIKLMQ